MRRKFIFAVASLFVVLLFSGRALACSCAGPAQPCQAFGGASAVFIGTPTGMETRLMKSGDKDEFDWTPRVYKFTVLQPFLGVEGTEVEVATGRGGGDCGYNFARGETYLVYAYGGGGGKPFSTSICTRTRPIASAAEDLEFLRGLPTRGAGVSISVAVMRYLQSVKDGDSKHVGGVASAPLVVEGVGERKEYKTDSEGRLQLTGLKPGKYKIKLLLPEELTTYKTEQELTVSDRGCASVFYQVTDNGRIGGKVMDNVEGKPVAGVLVALVDADDHDVEKHYSRLERTDDEGRYKFSGVPPGRYLLAVNFNRFPQPDDRTNAYPRTFYPGVADAAQAEVISLGAGEELKDRDLRVPQANAEIVVKGVVVWADGTPVPLANVGYKDMTHSDPGINYGTQADVQGRFTLKGFTGQTLLIEASSKRPFVGDFRRDGPMERAEKVRITLSEPTETVKIVITKIR
ncbi:MAG TPA: carboxypeptidase regulatory-like domain-containing protein [Pyrinomonadaceae bacterium]|nr:carboxypeptidase regulatory-like domain-containing protein [Pyrinomonadaceae bacterium]